MNVNAFIRTVILHCLAEGKKKLKKHSEALTIDALILAFGINVFESLKASHVIDMIAGRVDNPVGPISNKMVQQQQPLHCYTQ